MSDEKYEKAISKLAEQIADFVMNKDTFRLVMNVSDANEAYINGFLDGSCARIKSKAIELICERTEKLLQSEEV